MNKYILKLTDKQTKKVSYYFNTGKTTTDINESFVFNLYISALVVSCAFDSLNYKVEIPLVEVKETCRRCDSEKIERISSDYWCDTCNESIETPKTTISFLIKQNSVANE